MPAPKGNKNALKHGLYARKSHSVEIITPPSDGDELRGPKTAIRYLESLLDSIQPRLLKADSEEFTRLANALSLATTALFNGYRTLAFLTGGISPVDDALRELQALDYRED